MDIKLRAPANGPLWLKDLISSIEDAFRRLSSPQKYTVATLPDPTKNEGAQLYVSDANGGAVIAFSNGTDWLRPDQTIVS